MRYRTVQIFLALLALLSGGYVALLRLAGEQGAYLSQGYMLLPALAAPRSVAHNLPFLLLDDGDTVRR